MFETIYIEEAVQNHPRTQKILQKYSWARNILCSHYGEIFNRKQQNFRLQKNKMSLILAKKQGNFLQPIPSPYGIGFSKNYYFSHLYNCPFDCSYCYLQGSFRSANLVFFLNLEDFQKEIEKKAEESSCFFSGYDADSLAMEGLTQFASTFLPFFAKHPKAYLELRTKSIQILSLQKHPPIPNVIVAYTLSPSETLAQVEPRTPPLSLRLQAMQKLQQLGWQIGIRLDPLLQQKNFISRYQLFLSEVFSYVDPQKIHSVTVGTFRLPKPFYENMKKIGASLALLAPLKDKGKEMGYDPCLEQNLKQSIAKQLKNYLPSEKVFYI